jgi:uncharacterized metal-binding protein
VNREAHVYATLALAAAAAPFDPLVAAGAFSGLLLHPDLDQGRTPYGKLRKHRGLSHWPVVGTLDRLLWFAGPALAAWLWSGRAADWEGLALMALGLALADLLHVGMDKVERKVKRWR